MKLRNVIVLLLLALSFSGCDPRVDLENIETKKLLSVNCFISPQDTVHTVYLFHAMELGSVADPESALVKNAEVILTDGESSDTLQFNGNNSRYEATPKNLIIEPLETYSLIISTQTGINLRASCTVPPDPVLPKISGSQMNDDYLFQVDWANPFKHTYFVLSAIAEGTYKFNSPWGLQDSQLSAQLDKYSFPSDRQREFNSDSGIIRSAFLSEDPKVTIFLRNIDEDMFKYLKSFREYDNWILNSSGNHIPNFQDPQPIYSNIQNAVGIFAAYNTISVKMEIK